MDRARYTNGHHYTVMLLLLVLMMMMMMMLDVSPVIDDDDNALIYHVKNKAPLICATVHPFLQPSAVQLD